MGNIIPTRNIIHVCCYGNINATSPFGFCNQIDKAAAYLDIPECYTSFKLLSVEISNTFNRLANVYAMKMFTCTLIKSFCCIWVPGFRRIDPSLTKEGRR